MNTSYHRHVAGIYQLIGECKRLKNSLGIAEAEHERTYKTWQGAMKQRDALRQQLQDAKKAGNAAVFDMMLHTPHRKFLKFIEANGGGHGH